MRIRLLATIGGHNVGDVLDHDPHAAEWLIAAGFATAPDDDHSEPTEPADPPAMPQRQPAAPVRRADKRASR